MHHHPLRRGLSIVAGLVIALCSVAASSPPELAPPEVGDSETQVTAVDQNHIYWIQSTLTGGFWDTGFEYKEKLVDRNVATGTQRVLFTTTDSILGGLTAGGGRVTFTVNSVTKN